MRKTLWLTVVITVVAVVVLRRFDADNDERARRQAYRDSRGLYPHFGDQYKDIRPGMTLGQASKILSRSPDDSIAPGVFVWMGSGNWVEVEVDQDDTILPYHQRVKDIRITPMATPK
jgi:hypothetical protein